MGEPDVSTDARRAPYRGKRALDLALGSVLVVVTLPAIAVIALVSAIALRANPIFTQRRIGRGGREFRMIKVRTLPADADPYHLKADPGWKEHDNALLRAFRRLHLDELPQLWLVPTGRLSLVGPRPKMPDEFEPVDPHYGAARTTVPQGCTGLWQIGAHTDELPSRHPEYDLAYLELAGPGLDLWILARTLGRSLGLARPVRLDDLPRRYRQRLEGVAPVEEPSAA